MTEDYRDRVPTRTAVPDTALAAIRRYCNNRVPPQHRDQIRVECDVRGKSVTIYECRPPWRPDLEQSGPASRSPSCAMSPESTNAAVEDAVSAQFADRITGFSKVRFERMRQGRHASQYFDPARPEKTDDDARWAVELADEVLSATRKLLKSGQLDLY